MASGGEGGLTPPEGDAQLTLWNPFTGPDGTFFVDLAPVTDPALVVPTIAATLGIREEGWERPIQLALEEELDRLIKPEYALVQLAQTLRVDPADLQHEDPVRARLDRAGDRDGVDDPAVEVVLAVHHRGAQQARHRGAGDHRVHHPAGREPVLRGPLDARGHALEGHRQVLDPPVAELLLEQVAQRLVGVHVGAGAGQVAYAAQRSSRVHVAVGEPLPDLGQRLDGVQPGAVVGVRLGLRRIGRPQRRHGSPVRW